MYGVGRDQGVTASPTWAMLAAARGEPYTIAFSGAGHLQLAEDVAAACIAASRADFEGAATLNLSGPCPDVTEIVDAIRAVVPDAQIGDRRAASCRSRRGSTPPPTPAWSARRSR